MATKKTGLEKGKILLKELQAIPNYQNDRVLCRSLQDDLMGQYAIFRSHKAVSEVVLAGVFSYGQKALVVFIDRAIKISRRKCKAMLEEVIPWIKKCMTRAPFPSNKMGHPLILLPRSKSSLLNSLTDSGTKHVATKQPQLHGLLHVVHA